MQKSKKVILCVLLVLFIIIAIVAYIFSTKTPEEEKPSYTPIVEEKERFGLIEDYKEFFSIQATINGIENVEMDTSYFANEIYINTISHTYYYFIRCTKFAEFVGPEDKYLLLILDKNTNFYELIEINDTVDDLKSYSENYILEEKSINFGNKFANADESVKNILTIYLEYFKILLIKDSLTAYNMLTNETKAKYSDYNDFVSRNIEIYESFSSKIFSYSLEENENNNVYIFEDDNRNKITIYEESIMNFKISY